MLSVNWVINLTQMNKIYVLKNDKIMSGPFTLDALREKGLKSTEKIWFEGLAEWEPAEFLVAHGVKVHSATVTSDKKGFMKSLFKSPRAF